MLFISDNCRLIMQARLLSAINSLSHNHAYLQRLLALYMRFKIGGWIDHVTHDADVNIEKVLCSLDGYNVTEILSFSYPSCHAAFVKDPETQV